MPDLTGLSWSSGSRSSLPGQPPPRRPLHSTWRPLPSEGAKQWQEQVLFPLKQCQMLLSLLLAAHGYTKAEGGQWNSCGSSMAYGNIASWSITSSPIFLPLPRTAVITVRAHDAERGCEHHLLPPSFPTRSGFLYLPYHMVWMALHCDTAQHVATQLVL